MRGAPETAAVVAPEIDPITMGNALRTESGQGTRLCPLDVIAVVAPAVSALVSPAIHGEVRKLLAQVGKEQSDFARC